MTSREQKAMLAITIHDACAADAKGGTQLALRYHAGQVVALMRA
jgi:hypothetical protein